MCWPTVQEVVWRFCPAAALDQDGLVAAVQTRRPTAGWSRHPCAAALGWNRPAAAGRATCFIVSRALANRAASRRVRR